MTKSKRVVTKSWKLKDSETTPTKKIIKHVPKSPKTVRKSATKLAQAMQAVTIVPKNVSYIRNWDTFYPGMKLPGLKLCSVPLTRCDVPFSPIKIKVRDISKMMQTPRKRVKSVTIQRDIDPLEFEDTVQHYDTANEVSIIDTFDFDELSEPY